MMWCPECGQRRKVVDDSEESNYEGDKEIVYRVFTFACGHDEAVKTGETWPAP